MSATRLSFLIAAPDKAVIDCSSRNPHDNILLIGAGGALGVHGVQAAKCFGARVIAANVSDEKLNLAKQLGAKLLTCARWQMSMRRMTGGAGVEVAVDFVCDSMTFQSGIDSFSNGGRAVVVGAGQGAVTFNPLNLILNELIVTGSRHSTRAEFIETMEIMARGAG
jgi:D-arabinose 1-dehydrogenase-like Zn-dependent alcohol dehydrogenase